ncbi:MAG TPA: CheR family methyltransferase [Bacteroidia bacterium]|nr:CheR family methyltransferase [Bacteroidia bacterium]
MAKTVKIKKKENPFPIVAIGASAGGLEAMSELLKNLSVTTGMAYIYVQHLSPDHKSYLTSILSKVTKMKVQEIDNMELIKPNNVYVIPPNAGIKVTDGHIKLFPRSKGTSAISIDVLFSSLALTHKSNVIGIILSGYASDGIVGLKAIKEAGGITFAQDDSAQASSMPKSAIASGVVDYVLSPKQIAQELSLISKNGTLKNITKTKKEDTGYTKSDMGNLFELLNQERGIDFSYYKMPTIKRRLASRMSKTNSKTIADYEKLLLNDKTEQGLLYNDLLVNVTSFFRDAETFKYLKTTLLPRIIKNNKEGDTIRIWVPACSSGQEAYSIAMLITELQEKYSTKINVKIFATDISENKIHEARVGEYTAAELKPISKQYLNRFFVKRGESFQIIKELRDICVFAIHNILRDPPFSRMDFISCRNMLIYFESAAQKQVFNILHFALKEDGYLMLGKAETIGTPSLLFSSINKSFKIFSRKKNTRSKNIPELAPYFKPKPTESKRNNSSLKTSGTNATTVENAIDSVLLSNYIPACVVINKEMEVLQSKGPITTFLKFAVGKASLNILKMTRPEFSFELRNLIHKAIQTKKAVSKSGIEIKTESSLRKMTIEIRPLEINWNEPLFLILFTLQEKVEKIKSTVAGANINSDFKQKIKNLQLELSSLRTEMSSLIESHEKTFEELQASSEENVSANEEFQTLNEELETSKEEIEATNEELISTNQELQIRNDLLMEWQTYSEAIASTIHEPMLVLHTDFKVKSANKAFYEIFSLRPEETENKILFDLGNGQWNIPKLREQLNEIVDNNGSFKNVQVSGTFSEIGEKILLVNARFIIQKTIQEKLILLAVEDISEISGYYLKENTERKKAELKFRGLLESAPDAMVIVNSAGIIQLVNSQTEILFGFNRDEIFGKEIDLLLPSTTENSNQSFSDSLSENLKTRILGRAMDLFGQNKDGKKFPVEISLSQIETEEGQLISVAIRDISKQMRIEKELVEAKLFAEKAKEIAENAMMAKQQFLSNMSHEIRTPMNAILGFTKLIMKTGLTEKQIDFMNAIKTSGDSLIVLINDILDLAKTDSGKMEFEALPFKISDSIASMLHIFDAKIQENNLLFTKEYDENIPDVIIGDPIRLHQIILNLVSNAVKFTPAGEIKVSARLTSENENEVVVGFTVADTGIGIPPDQIDNIFENFQQATSSTSRIYGGTGLGLAIVKQLVEKQGGKVTLKSTLGKGSVFSFTLPFKKSSAQVKDDSDMITIDPEIKNIKVLIVEDVLLNQLLMKTILNDFGFEQDIAENGKVAIEKLKTKSYDIILMDLQMPEMNGFEATEYIRKKLKLNVPILALTADVTTVDFEVCKSVGMNDYIAKPVDEKLLYRKIVGLVKKPELNGQRKEKKYDRINKYKYIDLSRLTLITLSKPEFKVEMITLYMKQTPKLIAAMKQAFKEKDWAMLHSSVHKMIPSFSIMGISKSIEAMARKVQEAAYLKQNIEGLSDMISQIDIVCTGACLELNEELSLNKK